MKIARPIPGLSRAHRQRGVTLIELTVALVILGVIGILLVRWLQVDSIERGEVAQRDLLQRADDAVMAFAASNARLPCPATPTSNDQEDCTGGAVGTLPYRTLGLPDARAARVRYGVLRRQGDVRQLAGWNSAERRVTDIDTPLDADLAALRDQAQPLQITGNMPTIAPMHQLASWNNCASLPAGSPSCTDMPQLHLNSIDFCDAIRNASLLPASADHVHVRHPADINRMAGNVAFALAIPSPMAPSDEHLEQSPAFHSPRRSARNGDQYHDKVHAVGTDQLWTRLRCGDVYGPSLHAHPNVAMAARLTTPAMHNHRAQLDIMVKLGEANRMNATVAIIDASAELINTTAQTLDTVAEIFETYGGWNWRAAIAGASIGTAVGSVIAAGVAQGAADTYLATASERRDAFAARFPDAAEALESDIVTAARRADMLGGFPDTAVRAVAVDFTHPLASGSGSGTP